MQLFFWTIFTASIGSAAAQYTGDDTIGSCADVDCPSGADGTPGVECQVTNRTYGLIGLQTVPSTITDEGAALTWTIGTHVYEKVGGNNNARKIEKDFYLGTPPSLDLSNADLPYAGCAIFLHGNKITKPNHGRTDCESVIGSECLDSLLTEATAHLADDSQNGTANAKDACQRVQRALNANFTTACAQVSGQDSWEEIKAVALTGDDAPKPPNPSMNQSSTCHPTLPKSNDLTFVYGYNDTGTLHYNSTYPMFYAVNLVLTMFWSSDTTAEGALTVPESQLTCLWPVDLSNQQLETAEPSHAVHSKRVSLFVSFLMIAVHLL